MSKRPNHVLEMGLKKYLGSIEREVIKEILTMSNGNRSIAARVLKINRTTLLMKLRVHGLTDFLYLPYRVVPRQG